MPMTMIQGAVSLKAKLRRLPVAARQEIMKAMEAGANEIVELSRSLVPVESGTLRDSIGWTWGDAPNGSMVLGEVRSGRSEGNLRIIVYAGSDAAFYARWVEFGTHPHSVAKGGGTVAGKLAAAASGRLHPGGSAKPFFFPAYRAMRKRVKSRVSRAITSSAKRVAAGG